MTNTTPVTTETDDSEKLQLIDHCLPGLSPGDYTIAVAQTAKGTADKPENNLGRSFSRSQVFTVTGPRFTFPAEDIHQVYPPQNSQGHFARDLPHIVLNQRIVPWERNIWGEGNETPPTPWLALLVFDRSEILEPAGGSDQAKSNPTGTITLTVHDLLHPADASTAAPNISDASVTGEHLDPTKVMCRVLEIAPETFARVMPDKAELPYLAHARRVRIIAKADNPQLHPDRHEEDNSLAWYSVMLASRFPASPANDHPPSANVVHLVSLEGYTDYFERPSESYFQGKNRVRLVSLYSWTFNCEGDQNEGLFANLMHGLVKPSTLSSYATADDLMLRVPIPTQPIAPEEIYAYSQLRAGYTAMNYQTRQGETTYAWYRGAFTPTLPDPLPSDRPYPFLRSSQAAIYDPNYGIFDRSYGVAFETGRLLALSNGSFSANLLNWRSQIHRTIDLLQERKAQNRKLNSIFTTTTEQDDIRHLLTQNLITRTFLTDLTTTFTEEVAPNLHSDNLALPDVTPILPTANDTAHPTTFQSLKDIFTGQKMQNLLEEIDSQVLTSIVQGLARWYLLQDVPFNNLVPDPRMLPKESIRFFYLDRNWLEVLLEGALSVGIHSSRDEICNELTKNIILKSVMDEIHTLRDAMLGLDQVAPDDLGSGTFAGMLLRSSLVNDWSGLEIHAYGESNLDPNPNAAIVQTAAKPMKLLRLSKLSDDILLCLFPAVPAWVEIDQPKEALHFAVETDTVDQKQRVIYSRYVTGENTGKLIQGGKIVIPIDDETRRLKLFDLLPEIQNQPIDNGKNLDSLPTPAQFTLQMIYTPQSMVFQNTLFPPKT